MDSIPPVHIRWQDKIVGPFSVEQLRELAAGGGVTPATEVANDTAGPWARLDALPLGAVLFPPPPAVAFRVQDYERANTGASPPLHLADIIAAANQPIGKRPAGVAPAPPAPAAVSAEHDVRSLLRFNYEIDRRRGRFHLPPLRARPSRRRRDYLLLLAGGGGLILALLTAEAVVCVSVQTLAARMPDQFWPLLREVLFHSPMFAFGAAMFSFYAVALGWLMFYVMDEH